MFSQSKKKKKEQRWRAASVAWSCGVLAGDDKSDLPAWARQTEVSANQRPDFDLLFQSLCSLSLPDGHVKQIKTFEEHSICLSGLPRLLIISSRELFFFSFVGLSQWSNGCVFWEGAWSLTWESYQRACQRRKRFWLLSFARGGAGGGRLLLRWQEPHIIPENSEYCATWAL